MRPTWKTLMHPEDPTILISQEISALQYSQKNVAITAIPFNEPFCQMKATKA
jgi:hypothetical protein